MVLALRYVFASKRLNASMFRMCSREYACPQKSAETFQSRLRSNNNQHDTTPFFVFSVHLFFSGLPSIFSHPILGVSTRGGSGTDGGDGGASGDERAQRGRYRHRGEGGGGHGGRVTAKLLTSCRIADTTRKGSWYQIQVGPRPGRQCTVPADP